FRWQLRTQTVPSTSTPTLAPTATASAAASATLSPSFNAAGAAAASVSRRPVLSVRRRIINTPTAASESTTQIAELTTTSKYNRLRGKPDSAAAAAITTTPPTSRNNNSNNNNNSYLSKLKSSSATLPLATLLPATSSAISNINTSSDNALKQHKFQAASYALRRQFQTRRLTTTPSSPNGDESVTDVPRTQNPLFKRRLTLTSTLPPPRTTTTALSIETTTFLYGIEDDDDQVARSSIHTSRFNQIAEQLRPLHSSSSSSSTTTQRPPAFVANSTRRQMIPRPRRPQSSTPAPSASSSAAASPPASRRQQSRRRPHKYIEVYNRPLSKLALAAATSHRRSDAGDNSEPSSATVAPQTRRRGEKARQLQSRAPKVIVHGQGIIECRDQGNFPHPLSCRKFISCAKFDGTGGIVGWEYTCPKGLGYDGDSGMCTYTATSDGRACRD
ncbi:mucin-5AC-like, partial [Drosophila hydei]|uniref:Mucin-5AC-like n=1 Tax=Drosophila hydei TaxID=7224 RepID=A0A6J1MCU5_DROHY